MKLDNAQRKMTILFTFQDMLEYMKTSHYQSNILIKKRMKETKIRENYTPKVKDSRICYNVVVISSLVIILFAQICSIKEVVFS